MAEPDWLTYTGAVTGVIGAVTGIAGAIMGYVGYRRTEDLKSLDLRLELKKSETDLLQSIQDLPSHLEHAKRSRDAISSATGRLRSGALQRWHSEWAADLASAKELASSFQDTDTESYRSLKHHELERKLIAVHSASKVTTKLYEKYAQSLAADEKDRDHLKEDTRARWQEKLSKSHKPNA